MMIQKIQRRILVLINCVKRIPSQLRGSFDVIVTSECIHLYFLCIVTQCLLWDVFESFHTPMFRLGSFHNVKVMSSHCGQPSYLSRVKVPIVVEP